MVLKLTNKIFFSTMVALAVIVMSSAIYGYGLDTSKTGTDFPKEYFNGAMGTENSSVAKVFGTDKGANVSFTNPYTNQTLNTWAGTFNGQMDNNTTKFYCIDISHNIVYYTTSQPHTYTDDGITPPEITYILNNYYPFKALPYTGSLTETNEAAAVQLAIWHYADGMNLNTVSVSALKTRALQIKADADANAGLTSPFETLLILPQTQTILFGQSATISVSALNYAGFPQSGLNVNLSTSNGNLNPTSVVTGANGTAGPITLNHTGGLTATITANANAAIPQGTRFVHSISPNNYQKLVLATPTVANRAVTATVNWYSPNGNCDLNGYTTFTQGGWGSPSNSGPGQIRDQYFSSVFPTGLVIGGNFKITLTSATAVKNFLPQGSTAQALTQNYTNPTTDITVLAGQLAALSMNIYYNNAGYLGSNPTKLKDLVVSAGPLAGLTVMQVLQFGNIALGGGSTPYTFSELNNAATMINENFNDGTVNNNGLTCETVVPASLGDKVWLDLNKNGIQDVGENGVSGVTVRLYTCSNVLVGQQTTDNNGNYLFTNLVPGSYYVKFILPSGYVFSPKDQGSNDNFDSDADPITGKTICITLNSGQTDLSWDAGIYLETQNTQSDLSLTKIVDNATPNDGDNVTYTIQVTNHGPANATGVEVTDILPAGVDFLSASASTGSFNNTNGKWSVGNLNNGMTATLTITVKVNLSSINTSAFNLGAAQDFNLFVIEDLNQPSSDTEGKVAVGRDANLSNYSVGDKLPNSNGAEDVLVVGRDLYYTSGAVIGGNVVYGNATNLPIYGVSITGGTLRKDATAIDFADAASYLTGLSTQLSNYATNGTTTFQWSGLTLNGSDPYLNVFSVSGANLSDATNFVINVPTGSVVLVNVDGTNIHWNGGFSVNGTAKNNVLLNFYQETNLTIVGIGVLGSVLAPFADVNFTSGVINGQVICKSMSGQGQFNLAPFIGNIPSETTLKNIAEVTACDQNDPDSTPGNGIETEDDYGFASITVTRQTTPTGGTGNANWQLVSSFGFGEIVWTMVRDNNGNMLSGTWGGNIYRSLDNGINWTKINSSMSVVFVWSLAINSSNHIFAGTEHGVYKSVDDGASWQLTSLSGKDVRSVVITANGTLLAGTWGYGVYKSVDNGATWSQVNSGLANSTVMALAVSSNNSVFAGTFGAGVSKSVNEGASWSTLNVGYNYVWSLAITSDDVIFAGTYGNGLYRSTDFGATWSKVNNGLNANYIYAIQIDNDDNIFVSAWAAGVYASTNNGNNWATFGMGGFGVSSLLLNSDDGTIYAGTSTGQLYKSNSTVLSAKNETLPVEFKLEQNYPNPFNPTTTINFSVPQNGNYQLKVFNILGQEVATLLNGELKTGNHSINFDASKLASGVYVYRFTGNNVNISKKMLLQK